MKTYKQIYPQITAFENLALAFHRAARGKRKRSDVATFEFDLESNLLDLQNDLVGETYRPGPYFNFRIFDLHRWREQIIAFTRTLRITLHEPEAAVFPVSTGIPFLGWRVYPDHRQLKRRNGVTFQRRFAKMRVELRAGRLSYAQMKASVQSWAAHAAHGDTWGLRCSILSGAAQASRNKPG